MMFTLIVIALSWKTTIRNEDIWCFFFSDLRLYILSLKKVQVLCIVYFMEGIFSVSAS